mmetsp:Transcript_66876/g.189811  ORF Transcript_66876/g.189811 Transcript_66876/m.189811 type:complete len:201 (-) Transcript_66876:768-1370(-)
MASRTGLQVSRQAPLPTPEGSSGGCHQSRVRASSCSGAASAQIRSKASTWRRGSGGRAQRGATSGLSRSVQPRRPLGDAPTARLSTSRACLGRAPHQGSGLSSASGSSFAMNTSCTSQRSVQGEALEKCSMARLANLWTGCRPSAHSIIIAWNFLPSTIIVSLRDWAFIRPTYSHLSQRAGRQAQLPTDSSVLCRPSFSV